MGVRNWWLMDFELSQMAKWDFWFKNGYSLVVQLLICFGSWYVLIFCWYVLRSISLSYSFWESIRNKLPTRVTRPKTSVGFLSDWKTKHSGRGKHLSNDRFLGIGFVNQYVTHRPSKYHPSTKSPETTAVGSEILHPPGMQKNIIKTLKDRDKLPMNRWRISEHLLSSHSMKGQAARIGIEFHDSLHFCLLVFGLGISCATLAVAVAKGHLMHKPTSTCSGRLQTTCCTVTSCVHGNHTITSFVALNFHQTSLLLKTGKHFIYTQMG